MYTPSQPRLTVLYSLTVDDLLATLGWEADALPEAMMGVLMPTTWPVHVDEGPAAVAGLMDARSE
jgi:hypothetical protein